MALLIEKGKENNDEKVLKLDTQSKLCKDSC